MKGYSRIWIVSIRGMLCFTALTGILYPAAVTIVAQLFSPEKALGSLVKRNGEIIGSEWIGQTFSQPHYFWPRPSAIKYDSASSGASNLSLSSADLSKAVREREAQGAIAEMRFASGSGLDPHISPESSYAQMSRVAKARNLTADQTKALENLIRAHTEARQFGLLGEPRVNVLKLNLVLDEQFGK